MYSLLTATLDNGLQFAVFATTFHVDVVRCTTADIRADFNRGTDHKHLVLLQAHVVCAIIRRAPQSVDIVQFIFEYAGSLHAFTTAFARIQLFIAIARCAICYTLLLNADNLRITIGTIRTLLLFAHIFGVHPFVSHLFGEAA